MSNSAHDGGTRLELALRGTYDVAIIDWMLPERDGPAIIRGIRQGHLPTACLLVLHQPGHRSKTV